MIIVDSHCHLDMLEGHDSLDNIVARARQANVKILQTICTRMDNFQNILKIANQYDNVYASVGVHPSEVAGEVVSKEELLKESRNPKVIGLGETGLDYYYNKEETQLEMQRDSFDVHIKCSQENGLPIIIHTRDAEADTIRIVEENMKVKEFPALIHCFTASKEFAVKMLDLGLYISISGIVTFKNAEEIRDALKIIPLDRILVETDAPYLAPVPKRGKTNEPAFTRYVAEFIAGEKGVSLEQVANQTTENFMKLFRKAQTI